MLCNNDTAADQCVKNGHFKSLNNNRADVDIVTSGPGYSAGYSALHLAGYDNKLETLKILAENGADLDLKTPEGKTIFDIAVSHDHPDGRMKNYLKKFNENVKTL